MALGNTLVCDSDNWSTYYFWFAISVVCLVLSDQTLVEQLYCDKGVWDLIITTANSSLSNMPSLSMSDRSHTRPKTSTGNLEFRSTCDERFSQMLDNGQSHPDPSHQQNNPNSPGKGGGEGGHFNLVRTYRFHLVTW